MDWFRYLVLAPFIAGLSYVLILFFMTFFVVTGFVYIVPSYEVSMEFFGVLTFFTSLEYLASSLILGLPLTFIKKAYGQLDRGWFVFVGTIQGILLSVVLACSVYDGPPSSFGLVLYFLAYGLPGALAGRYVSSVYFCKSQEIAR